MDRKLQQLYDKLEQQRHTLLSSLEGLSAGQLSTSTVPGKWSVAEILSHLVTAERLSLLYIRKKMLGIAQTKDSGLWEEVKMMALIVSQRLPGVKFKAPKVVVEHTPVVPDLPELKREWDKVRTELRDVLESIPPNLTKRKIYRHVLAGYLNISHTLIFFREHIIHHLPQVLSQVAKR